MMIIVVVSGGLVLLVLTVLGLIWWLLAREDRINREPWMPGLVVFPASRRELASEAYRIDEFIEYAAAVIDG